MKTQTIIFTIFVIFSCVIHGFSQPVAEISYVTSKGRAILVSKPEERIVNGQVLNTTDAIELKDDAGVRILFLKSQQSKKYEAPQTVSMSKELLKLNNKPASPDKFERIKSEIGKFVRQYLKPAYNQFAGTRGLLIIKSSLVHDHILTFRQQPTIVIRGGNSRRQIEIYSDDQQKLTELAVTGKNDIVHESVKNIELSYNKTYLWKLLGEKQWGKIKLVSKQEAVEIERIIQTLKRDALDEIEAAQTIASYLFDQGFWAEAFSYVQQGLAIDPNYSVLMNLEQAILNLRPEDVAFQEAVEASSELSLRYSFHIKKQNQLQEIYSGGKVHSGDMMQIRLEASDGCFLFILNIDAGNNLYVLYPLENQDHFLHGGKQLVFPMPNRYFKADNFAGEEKLFLIASKIPLDYLAVELDKYFAAPTGNRFDVTRGLTEIRGFSKVVDEKGETMHDITEGLQSFTLSRLLKGKGLVVKEIVFEHVKKNN